MQSGPSEHYELVALMLDTWEREAGAFERVLLKWEQEQLKRGEIA